MRVRPSWKWLPLELVNVHHRVHGVALPGCSRVKQASKAHQIQPTFSRNHAATSAVLQLSLECTQEVQRQWHCLVRWHSPRGSGALQGFIL